MATRNTDVPVDQRIEYRIGINLGDVMVDGSDLAGDGINVAARLEALCEPGGICVSGSVREQVHGTLDVHFDDIGEQQVKNIARPIRAFFRAIRWRGCACGRRGQAVGSTAEIKNASFLGGGAAVDPSMGGVGRDRWRRGFRGYCLLLSFGSLP